MTWRDRAECRDANPEIFFVSSAGRGYATKATTRRALAYCDRCQVTEQCLSFAIAESRNDHGIWGGLTSTQRMRLRQERARLVSHAMVTPGKTPTAPVRTVKFPRSG